MLAGNVRRDFRRARALVPDLDPSMWTPRELRHSFLSVLSDAGVSQEQISQLVGHSGTTVTELVYQHQLRPVIQTGATVMDQLSSANRRQADWLHTQGAGPDEIVAPVRVDARGEALFGLGGAESG